MKIAVATGAACFALGCPAGSLSQPSALAITLAACRVGVALRLAPCGRALTLCFPHVVAALGEAAAVENVNLISLKKMFFL